MDGLWETWVTRWRQKAEDREEWASVIKETKALKRAVEPRTK
jgi:hypothetical protein